MGVQKSGDTGLVGEQRGVLIGIVQTQSLEQQFSKNSVSYVHLRGHVAHPGLGLLWGR